MQVIKLSEAKKGFVRLPRHWVADGHSHLARAFEHYNEYHPHKALKIPLASRVQACSGITNLTVSECPAIRGQLTCLEPVKVNTTPTTCIRWYFWWYLGRAR
ncbi:hypothetical protein F01_260316 [Burkholderia cenocepacia]|nr:hypothetical protein F01_260316 [Burkholderia cenocepacia]